MSLLLIIFFSSLLLSFAMTSIAQRFGVFYKITDHPNERKVHTKVTPRTGGLGIFFSVSIVVSIVWMSMDLEYILIPEVNMALVICGGAFIFLLGFWDDYKSISAKKKLFFQIIGISIAYYGGLKIQHVPFFQSVSIDWPILSYILTVMWFLLIINSINLIDGLDGLAGGIIFLTSCMLVFTFYVRDIYFLSILSAILAGSVLGFLPYNFLFSSIFLGDGGSYFLGYYIATLSLWGQAKSQLTTSLLVVALALGVPLFDTLLAPLRRFIRGEHMFSADKRHIHHRLVERGYTKRSAVFFLYIFTIILCFSSLLIVYFNDYYSTIFLLSFAIISLLIYRVFGYHKIIKRQNIFHWAYETLDSIGLTRSRRSFWGVQIDIDRSKNLNDLWSNIVIGINTLGLHHAALHLDCKKASHNWRWSSTNYEQASKDSCDTPIFRVELPLLDNSGQHIGLLYLEKDLAIEILPPYIFRRIENLWYNIEQTVCKIIDIENEQQ